MTLWLWALAFVLALPTIPRYPCVECERDRW